MRHQTQDQWPAAEQTLGEKTFSSHSQRRFKPASTSPRPRTYRSTYPPQTSRPDATDADAGSQSPVTLAPMLIRRTSPKPKTGSGFCDTGPRSPGDHDSWTREHEERVTPASFSTGAPLTSPLPTTAFLCRSSGGRPLYSQVNRIAPKQFSLLLLSCAGSIDGLIRGFQPD